MILQKYWSQQEKMVCWYELNWLCNLYDGPDKTYKIKIQSKNIYHVTQSDT